MNTQIMTHPVGVLFALLLTAAAFVPGARAADETHSLFNPTPVDSMRELSTDRPDKTESPFTVDAGHFQLEMDVVTFTHDRVKTATDNTTTNTWGVAPFNIKVGLTDNIDFQVVVPTYTHQKTTDHAAGSVDKVSGFGDITLRTKINFWGNNGGTTAFGIMPFIKLPTARGALGNGKVEGGVILPLAISLPNEFSLGVMTEVDVNLNETGIGHHAEFVNSVTLGKDLTEKLGAYAEFFTSKSSEAGAKWANTVDLGLTYALAANIQLDAGVNIGVTKAADDIAPFIGISFRW